MVGLVVLLAVAGLAWLFWVISVHGRPQVSSEMVGFDVDGQHAVVARFTVVRRDADVTASCLLRAYADDHSVVGEVTVPVTGARDQPQHLGVRAHRAAGHHRRPGRLHGSGAEAGPLKRLGTVGPRW